MTEMLLGALRTASVLAGTILVLTVFEAPTPIAGVECLGVPGPTCQNYRCSVISCVQEWASNCMCQGSGCNTKDCY